MLRRIEPHHALGCRLLVTLIQAPETAATLGVRELDLALRLARRARVLGRIAFRLEELSLIDALPPQAAEQLTSTLAAVEARQRVARWELNRIERALRAHPEIRVVVLKGCAYLLAGLPNAFGRVFADVDLLVPEGQLHAVERILQEGGWRGRALSPYDEHYYRAWTHELPPMVHAEREVEVDLHHNILPRTARLKPRSTELLRRAVPLPAGRFYRLSDVDLVLHAMTHLMFDSDMADGLGELAGVDDLLRHFASCDPQFWDALRTRTAELDLSRPVFYALRYAHRLLGTPIPAGALDESRAGAPPLAILLLMDRLVPLAMFPRHPDSPSPVAGAARFLLYVRSLWIRMPPLLLARHLSYKFYVRRVRRNATGKID